MGLVGGIILCAVNQVIGIQLSYMEILGITSLAVMLEQISLLGVDNISVPIVVAICWKWALL